MHMKNNFLFLIAGMFTFILYGQAPVIACTLVEGHGHEDMKIRLFAQTEQHPKVLYHTRSLDFREHILEEGDIHLLTNGTYEEVDLASTNIKKFGFAILLQSQASLLDLDLDDNGLVNSDMLPIPLLFTNLQRLSLNQNLLKDESMEGIGNNLKKLRELNIQYNLCTSIGISFLPKLTELQRLDCGYMKLGNEGMDYISQMSSLRQLFVPATGFDDVGLMRLLNLPQLEVINISYNKISPEALREFKSKTNATVTALHMTH